MNNFFVFLINYLSFHFPPLDFLNSGQLDPSSLLLSPVGYFDVWRGGGGRGKNGRLRGVSKFSNLLSTITTITTTMTAMAMIVRTATIDPAMAPALILSAAGGGVLPGGVVAGAIVPGREAVGGSVKTSVNHGIILIVNHK